MTTTSNRREFHVPGLKEYRYTNKEELVLKVKKAVGAAASAAAILTTLSPASITFAGTSYSMQTKCTELNGTPLSKPSGFVYQNTTYMPLFYVQQLLNALKVNNTWNGNTNTWSISTPFSSQPTITMTTTRGPMGIIINNKWFAHVNKIVTDDPSSHKATTFIPIWYIMKALQAIGLQSSWNGTTWNVEANYTDYTKDTATKPGSVLGSFTNLSDAKAGLLQYPGGKVMDYSKVTGTPVWTEPSFVNVDLRFDAPSNVNAASIDKYLSYHNSIMAGLGSVFMKAQSTYHVDANYLVSHAMEETGSGGNVNPIALSKNNLYGYGAYDDNVSAYAGTFPSEAYAILFQAWEVRNNYLNPGSSHYVKPTLDGMKAANYASDPDWEYHVNDLMNQFAIYLGDNVTSYQQYNASNQPPAPTDVDSPPVYYINGVTGTVTPDAYYQSTVPVYANAGLGHQHMFARVLHQGDQGDDVETLQAALNQQLGTQLDTDAIFGPQTAQAVADYQTKHGLPGTPGVVDFNTWNSLNLSQPETTVSAGQPVQIDEIVQGMVGNQVTEWYHIPSVNGWINSMDVTLNNVYKITVPNPSSAKYVSVPVTAENGKQIAILHAGDYVVSTGQTVGGKTQIQFNDLLSGTPESGYILSTNATLSKVTH
jgi:peptidoglycan hydrolase-like protein with peptidoglycan-binding domain